MRKGVGVLVGLALLGPLPDRGETPPPAALPCQSAVSGLDQRISAYLRPAVENRDFQGVVLVVCGEATVYRRAFSPRTPKMTGGVPATGHERFAIGSVEKTFTAAAILKLAQEERLHLSDPLSKFLPSFPHGGEITIEQLLGHSAGVRDYHALEDFAAHRKEPISLPQLVEVIGRAPLDFAPGTKSGYSSSGYALLARVVEVVSGRPFYDHLKTALFEPLGLGDTGPLGSKPPVLAGQDPGFPPSLLQPADESHPDWLTGSGSLVSSAEDLLRWYRRFAAGDVVRWKELSYPYGWSRREERGQQVMGQDGRIPGYATSVFGYPRDGVIVILLSNVQTGGLGAISQGLAALALGEPAAPLSPRRLVHLPAKSLGAYTGRYEMAPGNVLTVRKAKARKGKAGLELASSDGVFLPLDALGKDHFYYRALSADIRFETGPSGVTAMSWSGYRIPRAVR